jgi:hypothetical protein
MEKPAATTLNTPSEISPELIRAYRETHYLVGAGPAAITLRIDERSEGLARLYETSGQRCAAFVTAHNPFSETRSVETNLAAHARLRAELTRLTQDVLEGIGAHPSGRWEEKSFLALGVSREAAILLGTQFGQNAVVWVGDDLVPRLILLR